MAMSNVLSATGETSRRTAEKIFMSARQADFLYALDKTSAMIVFQSTLRAKIRYGLTGESLNGPTVGLFCIVDENVVFNA